MASFIGRVNDALPDPFGLRSKAVEVGLNVVDGALETTAYLAEKVHHAHSGVPKRSEFEGGDGPGQFHSPAAKVAEKLRVQIKTGAPAPVSLQGVAALVDAIASKTDLGGLDDRLYLVRVNLESDEVFWLSLLLARTCSRATLSSPKRLHSRPASQQQSYQSPLRRLGPSSFDSNWQEVPLSICRWFRKQYLES
ncbi:hypothetical protein FRC02_011321 [Tulasnella sp. 418]|nr:hypothetical protein FRC02_011321 [Tulasnella sp. 418]